MAIVEDHFSDLLSGKSDRRSALGGNERDSNVISGLDRISRPAIPAKNARTLRFDRPTFDVAFVIFRVEINLAMRIGPYEFGHTAGDGNGMLIVVSRIPMMRLKRGAECKERNEKEGGNYEFRLH